MNLTSHHLHDRTTCTKNATFPSLKKYVGCRVNESSAASAPGYVLVGVDVLVPLDSITWRAVFMARDGLHEEHLDKRRSVMCVLEDGIGGDDGMCF